MSRESSIESGTRKTGKTRTLKHGEETAHFDMLNRCYESWGGEDEWKRRYVQHPDFDITKNVVIVEDNNEWAGGGTAWFREALLKNNAKITIYGAGDLYVHPDHRGKGLYSTAMRSLNQLAQEKGAVLGFAYPSIYRLPAMALPKYGFVELFYPATHVLVLKPEKFFQFLISRAKRAFLSEKFDGLNIKLCISFDTPNGKTEVKGRFRVEKGQISELKDAQNKERMDLIVKAHINIFLHLISSFYVKKRPSLYLSLLRSLLKRQLRVRFSARFIRMFLGL